MAFASSNSTEIDTYDYKHSLIIPFHGGHGANH